MHARRKIVIGIGVVMTVFVVAFLLVTVCVPICVLRPEYEEPVAVSDIPSSVVDTFQKACPHAELVWTWKHFAGDKFIFYVFRFHQNGKLQEALVTPPRKLEMIYDIEKPDAKPCAAASPDIASLLHSWLKAGPGR